MERPDGHPAADPHTLDQKVEDQYTRYPYPPADADTGLALFSLLDYVRHVLWPGRPSLEGLRVLDAGCGTGHTAVQIARHHPEVTVVAMDISAAALDVARDRARAAGVPIGPRLDFRQGRIEDGVGGGPFDYIVSSGVLHHLADPVEGARRLAAVLAPNGGIGIMLYAPHGRHGVYLLQEALRRLVGGEDLAAQTGVARQLLAGLLDTHPFKPAQFSDQGWKSDAGLVDLLLHARDRSYSVPQVFDLLEQSGLRLERFFDPFAYRAENHNADTEIKRRLAALDQREGAILAELLCGTMPMHAFFATHAGHRPARAAVTGVALSMMRPRPCPLFRWEDLPRRDRGASWKTPRKRVARSFILAARNLGPLARSLELEPWIADILERCDGRRTARQILDEPEVIQQIPGVSADDKQRRYGQLMEFLAQQEVLLFEP